MITENPESFPVALARESVSYFLARGKLMRVPDEVPDWLKKKAAAFVTLRKEGELRGCIGTIVPKREWVAEEIIRNAVSAASRDPRFPPVVVEELRQITFSVDILESPEPASIADLDPKIFGVIVKCKGRTGLLLPNIEGVVDPRQQIEIARRKGGILPWEKLEIQRFRVTRYGKK